MKWLGRIALLLCLITVGTLLVAYLGFRASLPILEGNIQTSEISDNVLLERDGHGNATLTASNRLDLSYASGFLHAQERFFQMDLSRRLASGELSELFGSIALSTDRRNRLHRFRSRASVAIGLLPDHEKELLVKYAQGVNDGLGELGSQSFEYWLLGVEPELWTSEDTILAVYSMYFTLQNARGQHEWQNHLIRKTLDPDIANFLLRDRTFWDAPLQSDEEPFIQPAIPDASVIKVGSISPFIRDDSPMLGSSNWAVSGKLTETGAAMVSNDMHLDIRAPSIWYKLRMKLTDGSLDITGVSLPGAPAIVAGSNGWVAWGFTNANIDTSDIIELTLNPDDSDQYLTKDGFKNFTYIDEVIGLKGGTSEVLSIRETIWGPVMDMGDEKTYAYRWVAHMPDGVNFSLMNMEGARSVSEAIKLAGTMGVPAQNALVVDSAGNAAWTIFGKIPNRPAGDYRKITNWSNGEFEWNDWYGPESTPKVLNPENDRLWTANARVLSGTDLKKVGIGRYDLGARAKQIKDRLFELDGAVQEEDLYKIMLDDEAEFLSRWQKQLVETLSVSDNEELSSFLNEVENWGGRADKNSVGFRLVREYRDKVSETLLGYLTAACVAYEENCNLGGATRQWEAPLWQLIIEKPQGWLPEGVDQWQVFFEKQAANAWFDVISGQIKLDEYTWGARNVTEIVHPLSRGVPFLGRLTDMPQVAQSGDTENMPYISGRSKGQSERMVVSPGHEENGILDLPAGQSGHPLSPYFGSGHDKWLNGEMTPFLPQETKWQLDFTPVR